MMDLIEKIPPRYKTVPFVLSWVLTNLARRKDADPHDARRVEQTYVDAPTLRRMLETADTMLLSQAFAVLAPVCFDDVLDGMIETWPEWNGITAYRSGSIISSRQPSAAAMVFRAHCRGDDRHGPEPTRIIAILSNQKAHPDQKSAATPPAAAGENTRNAA